MSSSSSKKSIGKSLADALAANDPDTVYRNAIDARLAAMRANGPEEWDYERDFAKGCGYSEQIVQRYRVVYKRHVAIAPRMGDRRNGKCIWFADAAVADKFRAKSGAKSPDDKQP